MATEETARRGIPDRFVELGGSLIVEVKFIASPEEKQRLLQVIAAEKVRLFYAETPATFGALNPESDDIAQYNRANPHSES